MADYQTETETGKVEQINTYEVLIAADVPEYSYFEVEAADRIFHRLNSNLHASRGGERIKDHSPPPVRIRDKWRTYLSVNLEFFNVPDAIER